ncbi:protein spinster homolog 3-like [Watersipora subatra]|uniref:protein spinster homolog 3-like n=1 Tax=Watersipora subatra TaxID=2589382 RepID=UPI00355AE5A9
MASMANSTPSPEIREPVEMMAYWRRYVTVAVLCFVNLLNYMDRYTIAGILVKVEHFYHIDDGNAGLLQSIFVVGFACTAPIFGYCGDRYNRKWLMVAGIGLWSAVTLAGSFIPSNLFGVFVALRGLVGVGEASYVTIAPTIISDMFINEKRSFMLMLFYFAIPVGSGLGYIVGSELAKIDDDWRWALRLTPILGTICCLLIIFVAREPPRGMAEDGAEHQSNSTLKQDLIALFKNKTFVLSTVGNTTVTFVSGALALFAPKFLGLAYKVAGDFDTPSDQVALIMGIITTVAGFVGVALGTNVARKVKQRHPNGDPLVCAFGLLASTPFFLITLVVCEYNLILTWISILIGEVLLFMNWPIVADILLYSVPATLRSSAEAVQLFVCHILGDAFSPPLLGVLSVTLRGDRDGGYYVFQSLQYSLFVSLFITVIGGSLFLACSFYIVKDKEAAEAATKATAVGGPVPTERPLQSLPLDDMLPLFDDNTGFGDFDDVHILPT